MKNALRSELRKITTTRLWWLLAIVMFAYMAVLGAVMAFSFTVDADGDSMAVGLASGGVLDGQAVAQAVYTLGNSLGYVFPLVIGALAMTSEFRHQTITPTLLHEPRRSVMLAAKLVSHLLLGIVYGVVGTAGAVAMGAPLLAFAGDGTFLSDPAHRVRRRRRSLGRREVLSRSGSRGTGGLESLQRDRTARTPVPLAGCRRVDDVCAGFRADRSVHHAAQGHFLAE